MEKRVASTIFATLYLFKRKETDVKANMSKCQHHLINLDSEYRVWTQQFLHLSIYWHNHKKHTNKLFSKAIRKPVALNSLLTICLYLLHMYYTCSMIIENTLYAYAHMNIHTQAVYITFIYIIPFLYLYHMYNELCPTLLSNDKLHLYKGQCYINLEKHFLALSLAWQSHLILLTDFIDRFLP